MPLCGGHICLHFEQWWVMWWALLLETQVREVCGCLSMLEGCGTAPSTLRHLRWVSLYAQMVWDSIEHAETPVMGLSPCLKGV